MHAMVVEVVLEIEQLVFENCRRPETTGDPNTLGEGCRLAVPTENPIQRFSPDVTCCIGLKTGHNIARDSLEHLLPLMEADRRGRVSRQEYMKFMAAEFDRLDKAKSGELDVKVLTQSKLSVSRFVGK